MTALYILYFLVGIGIGYAANHFVSHRGIKDIAHEARTIIAGHLKRVEYLEAATKDVLWFRERGHERVSKVLSELEAQKAIVYPPSKKAGKAKKS